VKACVALNPGATASEAELLAYCRERLVKYKLPTVFEFHTELPKTGPGKIDKHDFAGWRAVRDEPHGYRGRMSGAGWNAARQFLSDRMTVMSSHRGETDYPLRITDDFVYDDRRRGGFSYGTIDAEHYPDFLRTLWDIGGGQVSVSITEVVAIRGDRLCLTQNLIEYSNGSTVEILGILQLGPDLTRSQRIVDFDPEDRAAACAELDRMHEVLVEQD